MDKVCYCKLLAFLKVLRILINSVLSQVPKKAYLCTCKLKNPVVVTTLQWSQEISGMWTETILHILAWMADAVCALPVAFQCVPLFVHLVTTPTCFLILETIHAPMMKQQIPSLRKLMETFFKHLQTSNSISQITYVYTALICHVLWI